MNNKFLKNKYTKWYFNIINKRCQNIPKGYTEKYHILPASLGGDNLENNLVVLTAKEHYICHLLLTKMCKNKQHTYKMFSALWFMSWGRKWQKRHKIPGRIYQYARENYAKVISERKKGKSNIEQFGEKMAAKISTKLSEALTGENNPMFGKNHSDKSKKAMSENSKGKGGHKPSPLQSAAISKANRERVWSKESRKKVSQI